MVYSNLASEQALSSTVQALQANGFLPEVFNTKKEVFNRIQQLIPQGATVMNGASKTLEQVGFVDYLKLKTNEHGWKNLHDDILAETDPAKQMQLRKTCVVSDFYLGSAHAVSETGEMVIASASGSQLAHYVFTSQNLILVVGTQKISRTLEDARKRVGEYVFQLEDERIKSIGYSGSLLAKELIFYKEMPLGRKIYVLLVKEELGF